MAQGLAQIDGQTILALLFVAAAAAYLVRRGWRAMSGACHQGCGQCAADVATGATHKPLVQVELPSDRTGGARS